MVNPLPKRNENAPQGLKIRHFSRRGQMADICPTFVHSEIEIKKEIDIELEKEGELKTEQALARSYGRYENVFLTDTELSELQAELPEKWAYYIERLSGYIASTGKKYQNHAATIRRWAADDTAKAAPKQGMRKYTCKEGESLWVICLQNEF